MKRKKMISILLILIMILQGSMPAMAAPAGMGSETEQSQEKIGDTWEETEHETTEALATETTETVTETPETEETPAQTNEETQEQEGDVQSVPKASISLFSDFSNDLFVDGPTETIKKTFKKPANGISKAVIQLESKKEGYVKGEDLSVNFGIELILDDGWLYTNLLVHEGDAGYPQFSGNPEDYDLYNAAVDEYLQGLSEDELPTIEYIYDLGPSFALPEGEEKNSRDLMSGDEKVGTILTEKRDSDHHCIVTVSFDKKVYNRESVAAGARIGLQIDENALKDGEPVFAGWLDGQLVVETSGKLNPDDPADVDRPEYTVEKTGPEKVDTPYVDYTIHVETKKDGLDLSGMVLVDDIPLEMKLVSAFASGNELSESSDGSFGEDVYVIGSDGKFLYQFPDAAAGESPLLQADLTLRLALKDDVYKAGINSNGGIQATLSNEASLWNKERTEEKARSQAVETGMDLRLVSKDGRQEGMNGLRYSWTLDINTQFSHMAEAYLVDRICLDDHEFDAASGLQVYRDGRFLETLPFAEKTLENPIYYEDLTKENIRSIAGDNSFYYTYTGADGKNYAVLIIPFNDGYQNHKIKIKYFTDLNRGGLSVEEWLDKNNDQPKNLANDVKFLWKWFRYGDGPEWTDFTWDIDLRKEVNTSVTLGRKNAGNYNESTQMMRWKFTVNEYGALLENTNITDILDPQVYDLSTLKLTYKKYNRDDKRVESGNLASYTIDPGSGELVIQLGEVLADTYYEIFLDVKVIAGEFLASQGSNVGTLGNTAVFSAVVNGQEKVNSLDAEKILKNTLISKTVEGGYDYRTKEILWKVTMDMNHLPVEGAQITDTLPDGSSFGQLVKVTRLNMDGSIETGVISGDKISFDNLDITMTAVPGKTGDGKYTKDTAAFSFHDKSGNVPVNDSCYVFEYTTVISDEQYLKDVFKAEEDVEVKNHVALSGKIQGKEIDATANSEAVVFVKSGSIVKEGTYVPADGLIHWKISFNQDRVDLSGMVLVEEIGDQPLEILEDTVKLYEIHPDGTRTLLGGTKQGDAALPGLSVLTIKTLNYTIPADQGNMELCMEFDTALTESALKEDISNDAKLMNGDEVYQEVNGADGCYDGQFDIDDYVKSAKKPVFQLIKTSSNDDEDTAKLPLAGAEFKLEAFEPDGSGYKAVPAYDKKGSTGKDGKITFVNLRKNFVYKLSEKSAPVGYEFNTDDARYYIFEDNAVPGDIKKLNVDGGERDVICMNAEAGTPAEGLDGKLVFHNTPKADIKFSFTKENPDGTKGGAKFRLQDTQGCLKARETWANADGLVSFEKVDPGNYLLTEMTSQDPFDQGAVFNVSVKPDGSFSITKKSGNGSVEGTNSTTGYTIKNEYVKGTIILKKQDSEEGNIPLAGAVFTLYDAAGRNPVRIGGKEVTAVSGSDGIATFSQIPYSSGGYKIIETVPPKGYEITDTISVDVTGTQILEAIQAQTVEAGTAKSFKLDLSVPGKELKNVRTKGTVTLTKTNDAETSLKLANRTFVLSYNDSDGYNGWSKGEEVARETTDDGGIAVFNDVPYGNYKISEVHGEKDIYKTFDKDFNLRGQIETELENHRKDSDNANDNTFEIGIDVVNTLIKGDFSIHKSNVSTGEKMQGVTFVLSGNDAYGDPVYMEKSTDSQGKLTCSSVPVSETYYNLEEVQHEGFEQGDAYHVYVESVNTGSNGNINNNASIRIIKLDGAGNETGDATEITGKSFDVTNIPIKGRIEFKKVDADTPGKGLAGAEFVLRRIVNGSVVTDPDSDLAPVTAKSNDNGDVVFENVEFGNYEVEEIKAPDGYIRNTAKISITAEQLLETVSGNQFHFILGNTVPNKPTVLAIEKKDQFGKRVTGAELELSGVFVSENGSESAVRWTTTDTDKILSGQLIVGNTYTLKEVSVPESGLYKDFHPVTFKVKDDGTLDVTQGSAGDYSYSDGQLAVVDAYYLANVKLRKTDTYNPSKPLPGVLFDLYKQAGDVPDFGEGSTDIKILEGLQTDAGGIWNLSGQSGTNPLTQGPFKNGLPLGKYYFVESVPHGDYILDKTPKCFEVKAEDDGRTIEISMDNKPVFTSIRLKKVDGTDGHGIGRTSFQLEGPDGLIGQFTTVDSPQKVDYIGVDGTAMSVSLSTGELFISGLNKKGSYTLTETVADVNYELSPAFKCTFEITSESESGAVLEIIRSNEGNKTPYNLSKISGEWNAQGVLNTRKTGAVTLKKQGDMNGSMAPLAGAEFTLFYNSEDKLNTVVEKNGSAVKAVTDSQGMLTINGLDWGKYYLKETKAPDGYVLDNTQYEFEIQYGNLEKEFSVQAGNEDVVNKATRITFEKVDRSTKQLLTGAVFEVEGIFANDTEKTVRTFDLSTVSSLAVYGEFVGGNTYTLKEIQAPAGYVPNSDGIIFDVGLDGNVIIGGEVQDKQTVTVENSPAVGSIKLRKVDSETPENGLGGAEFVLRRIVDGTVVTDPDSDLAPVTVKSNDEGDAVFENVEFGNYEIEEIKAPDGYIRNTEKISVSAQQILETVSEGGFHCILQAPVTNRPVTLAIGKKDSYGEKVPGAQMKLTGIFASGNGGVSDITWTTSETDKDISRELICGNTYTLTETASPQSGYYQKISAITFKVGEDGILSEISGADGEYVYRDGLLTVVDSYYLADVQLVKTDKYDASKSLANVTFDLYKQTGDEPDLRSEGKDLLILAGLKTDDQGTWKLSGASGTNPVTQGPLKDGLPPGKYYFMEKVPHEDYVLDGEPEVFEVKASDHGRTVEKVVKNAPVFTSIKLLKLDGTDGQGIGGTAFRLDGPEGAIGQFSTTDSSEDMVYTGADGSQMSISLKKGEVFISGLVQKGSYTLTEIKENDNYENASYFQCRFEITSESESGAVLEIHSGNEGSATPYNLTKTAGEWNEQGIVNHRKTGSVTLKKLGDLNGTKKPLAGAEFTLFYNSGEHKDTAVLKDGNKVFAVTDDQGCITIDGLGWDSYYLKETKAPEGFALDNAHLEFEIGYGNLSKGFSLFSGTDDVVNKATEVTFNKLDRSTKDSLAGAVFTVEGIFTGETKETTRTLDMTETGSLTVYGEWVGGNTYTLKEIKAPDGYILEIAPTTFTVGFEGEVIVGDKIQENETISVENSPIEVSLKKMDGENKNVPLAGAVFTLVDDTLMGQGISVVTATEGIVLPGMIQGHKYTLEEVKAPDGYSMGGDTLKASFMVEEDGTVRIDHNTGFSGDGTDLLTCENRMVQLRIQKFSPDGRALKGCVFEVRGVFASLPQNRVFGRMGEETIIVDDEHPDALKGRLIVGNTYVLKEHTPPHGFEVGGEVKFTVNGDGTLTMEASHEYTLDEKTGAITMVNDPVEIGFFKTDMEGSPVEGSVFKVTGDFADGSTEQVIRLDGKEPVVLKELFKESEEGVQYILEEVSPPEGYEALKEPVSFKVSSGGEAELTSPNDYVTISEKDDIYYFRIKNEKIKEENKPGSNGQSTLTGDNTPVWAGIVFMIASASVILGTALSRRRKRTMK